MSRHPLDGFGLWTGVFFTALAAGFLLHALDVWDLDAGWIAPMLLIVLGLAGVLLTVSRASRGDAAPDTEPAEPAEPDPVA